MSPRPNASLRLLAALTLSFLAACAGKAPIEGLRVRTAEQARPHLLMQATLAPIDRVAAKVDALAQAAGLPFRGSDVRAWAGARLDLPPDLVARLDGAAPIAVVTLARGKDEEPFTVLAANARSGDAAREIVAALGPVVQRQEQAEQVQRPDGGTLWVLRNGARLFVADTVEALVGGAALALEAQRAPAEELVITTFPPALARWQQTDILTGLRNLKQQILAKRERDDRRRGRVMPLAERAALEATLDATIDPLAASDHATLALELAPAAGVRVGLRLAPTKGTHFAREVARRTPFALDARLATSSGAPPALVVANGPSLYLFESYRKVVEAQGRAGVEGAAEVARLFAAAIAPLDGAVSAVVRLHDDLPVIEGALGLRAGIGADGALAPLQALIAAPALEALLRTAYGGGAPALSAAREAQRLRVAVALPEAGRRSAGAIMKGAFGTNRIELVAGATGRRLLVANEPGGPGRLIALAAPPSGAAAPAELADALAEARGRDGFIYVDLWRFVRPAVAALARGPEAAIARTVLAFPGFANLKLPLYASHVGGERLDIELRVPLVTLGQLGGVLKLLGGLGVMSAPPSAP